MWTFFVKAFIVLKAKKKKKLVSDFLTFVLGLATVLGIGFSKAETKPKKKDINEHGVFSFW